MFIKYSHACRVWHQQRKRQSGKSSPQAILFFASLFSSCASCWLFMNSNSSWLFFNSSVFILKSHKFSFFPVGSELELGYGKRKRNEAQKVAFKYRSIMTAQSQVVLYYSTFHLFPFNYFFFVCFIAWCNWMWRKIVFIILLPLNSCNIWSYFYVSGTEHEEKCWM